VRWVIRATGGRVSEAETKFVLLIMFFLGGVADAGGSEPILPRTWSAWSWRAPSCASDPWWRACARSAFTVLTPFYFIRAGTYVVANAVVGGAGLIALLLGVKLAMKYIGVRPLAPCSACPRARRPTRRCS